MDDRFYRDLTTGDDFNHECFEVESFSMDPQAREILFGNLSKYDMVPVVDGRNPENQLITVRECHPSFTTTSNVRLGE